MMMCDRMQELFDIGYLYLGWSRPEQLPRRDPSIDLLDKLLDIGCFSIYSL